jgi:hypothetical protein
MKITRYYSPDGGGGGGNPPAPDADLEKFESYELKGLDKLTEEEKKDYEVLKGKYDVQYVGDDGKPLSAEQIKVVKETEAKVKTILAKDEKTRTVEEVEFLKANLADEPADDIYEQVNALTGFAEQIDYGDTDPKSPEGIAKREMVIRASAQKQYDDELKEKYPEGYRYIEFLSQGGKPEDFFKSENKNWKGITITKTDKATQERVLREALAMRGNKPNHIDALIQIAKDKDSLYEDSKTELEALMQMQEASEQDRQLKAERAAQMEEQAKAKLTSTIIKELEKGIGGNPLSYKDRVDFMNFIQSSVRYYNGKFIALREFNVGDIAKELQTEFYRYKGGNLEAAATAKAKSLNAQRLKIGGKRVLVPKGTPNNGGQNFTPISSVIG